MLDRKLAAVMMGLVAFTAIAIVGDAQPRAGSQPKVDQSGDPLPPGALARMGSLRWRHGDAVSYVAFSSDGKAVLTAANDNTIRLWDRETGKEIRRFDMPGVQPVQPGARPGMVGWNTFGRGSSRIAVSPDGKLLAAVLNNNAIQIWNVETGKELRQFKGPQGYVTSLLFAPDGKSIAARGNDRTTYLIETETGKELRQIKAKQPQAGGVRVFVGGGVINGAEGVAFSPDSKTIATAEMEFDMQKATVYIKISETDTGKEIRQIDATQGGVSSIAYSPDGKTLAFGSGTNVLLREADTGKEIRTINNQGGIAGLQFAPNSRTLAVKGRDQIVRLFDPSNGNKTHELGEAAVVAGNNAAFVNFNMPAVRDFAFSHDGKLVGMGGSQTLRFFTVETGKEQATGGGHRGAVATVLITPDGKTMISRGADGTIRRWDTADGKELGQFNEPKGTTSAVFAPDGKSAALASADGTIRLVAVADGKELHSVKGHQNGTGALAFSPDSKVLASRGSADGTIRLFDAVKGGEIRQITLPGANPAGPGGVVFIRGGYAGNNGMTLVFSPDGNTLTTSISPFGNIIMRNPGGAPPAAPVGAIHMWDVATGKEIRKITLPANRNVTNLAYSPDGRLLAAENADQTISLWEIASGRERALLGTPAGAGQPNQPVFIGGGFGGIGVPASAVSMTIAMSPDGSLLAARGADNTVRVWEIAHAKDIGSFKGHTGTVQTVAFAPNGKSIASGSTDTTILVWDVSLLSRAPKAEVVELKAKEVETLWADLIGDDAIKAGQSILKLASAPKQTTPFLSTQLKSAVPVDVKKIDQWVADLDSANFPKRTKASAELEKLGELAIPALKKILAGQPSPETRRRVEPLLEKLTTGTLSAEQLRLVRAVEVLEKIGGAEARRVLEPLAKGAPGALPTLQAQAVLDRLK